MLYVFGKSQNQASSFCSQTEGFQRHQQLGGGIAKEFELSCTTRNHYCGCPQEAPDSVWLPVASCDMPGNW